MKMSAAVQMCWSREFTLDFTVVVPGFGFFWVYSVYLPLLAMWFASLIIVTLP